MARNRFLARLIFLVFFVISLLTNILGPIVPGHHQHLLRQLWAQRGSSSSPSSSPMASCPSPPDFSSSATPKSLS